MDSIDRKQLKLQQQDVSLPFAALAEKVGLSPSACWR